MEIEIAARASLTKTVIETCVELFKKELKLQNSKYSLVILTDRGMSKRDGCRGTVFQVGPKSLGMVIDTAMSIENLIITLAHEMVHVKQYARGQITHGKNLKSKFWMGQRIKSQYYDSPWEIEAYSKERVLANKIFKIIDTAHAEVKKHHKK
jgi:hypothetical protein